MTFRFSNLFVSRLIIVAFGLLSGHLAQAQTSAEFDLPAQPLSKTLHIVGDHLNTNILFDPLQVKGVMAPALKGAVTIEQALSRLLLGTQLRYEFMDDRTVSLMRIGAAGRPTADVSTVGATHLARAGGSALEAQENGRQGEPQSEEGRNEIQEIIVTAQKREERLQEVPISISVLGGRELDRSIDRGVADALNRVPGVTSSISNATARVGGSSSVVVVRGVSANVGNGASATAYYLDSIPFGFAKQAYAPDANAYDLERLEVLRGPQGTLYGASALNGVVRVLTKDAALDKFEFKARTSVSGTEYGGENYRGDMMVNVPIVDGKLGARAVLGYQDLGGWIDRPLKKDANDEQIGNYRLKINAQPTDRLSLGLLAWLSRTDIGAPSNSADGRQSLSRLDEVSSTNYDAYGLKIGYEFPSVSIASMTSYIDYKVNSFFDYGPFNPSETLLNSRFDSTVLAQEATLNSTFSSSWRWSVGGMYRRAEDLLWQFRSLYLAPTDLGAVSKSFAVFGELTHVFLNGRFELTGGLRYFEDEVKDVERSYNLGVGGIPPGGLVTTQNRFEKTSPRVVLAWHPVEQTTVYASYAEGFRSGLNQAPGVVRGAPQYPAVKPDGLKNYELGAKGSLWGGRFSFDAAVFHMNWQGVQQTLGVLVAPGFITTASVNAESASGEGFEFGVSARPADGLTLSANFSWNGLEIDHDVISFGAVLYPKGARLSFSPEYTAGVSADYVFSLGANGFNGRLSVSANYLPEQVSARTAARTFSADAALPSRASIGIESRRHWTASVFVDNLTNETGISRDSFSPRWNTYLRPRTIGAQFEYRY